MKCFGYLKVLPSEECVPCEYDFKIRKVKDTRRKVMETT